MTSNTLTFTDKIAPTKNQILERLLRDNHITFEEMLILMEKETIVNPYPVYPGTYPQQWPVTYTGGKVETTQIL